MLRSYRGSYQDAVDLTLAERLDYLTSDVLKEYVSFLGGKSSITRKADRIAFICGVLLDPGSLSIFWNQMDSVSQRAVSTAYHNGGSFNQNAFVAQYGALPERPDIGRRLDYWNFYLSPMLFDLLLIDGAIPPDVMPLLGDLVLHEDRYRLEGVADDPIWIQDPEGNQFPITIIETETGGRINLLTYLRMVEQGQLSFASSSRRLTAGSIKKVYGQLVDGDFVEAPEKMTGNFVVRPFALDVFTQSSGFMTSHRNLSKEGKAFLETQDIEMFEDAFQQWVEKGSFDELSRIDEIKGLRSKKTRLTVPSSRREKIIEALSWCPAGEWIHIQELFRAMIIWDFDIELETTPDYNLSIKEFYWEMSTQEYHVYIKFPYVVIILIEYLATLGLIDVAITHYSPYGGDNITFENPTEVYENLCHFRINAFGAYVFGQADEYLPHSASTGAKFSIDGDLCLTLSANALPGDKLFVETLSEPLEENRYKLNTIHLLDAIHSGQAFASIRSFLLNGIEGQAPAELLVWLDTLEANLKAVKPKQKATIYTVNKAVAALMETDQVLRSLGDLLTANTVLITSGKDNKFRKRLKELGYLVG
ncbi:MAG: hypothetical protein AAF633_08750 [Chloroflexota bacterium]